MAVRKYELMVILDPARTEEEQSETLGKIEEVIEKYGGKPDKRDVWGKRRLAFQINRRREGYYAIILFDVDSGEPALAEVDRYCKFREEILRHLVTLAVVGKAAGDPALAEQALARQAAAGGPGGRGGYRGDRGEGRPPRRDYQPREGAEGPAAVAEPATEVPSAAEVPSDAEAAPATEAPPAENEASTPAPETPEPQPEEEKKEE